MGIAFMKLCTPITLLSLLVFISIGVQTSPVQAQEPVIAPEIGKVIAEEGVDAANQRFEELMASPSLDYGVETQGLMTLLSAYMQAGNQEAAEAVGEMYAQLMQSMLSGAPGAYPQGMAEAMAEAQKAEEAQRKADEEADRQLELKQLAQSRGTSREARRSWWWDTPTRQEPTAVTPVARSSLRFPVTATS